MPPQIENAIKSPAMILTWAAILFLVALACLRPEWHGMFEMVPEEAALKRVEGTLAAFRQHRNEEGLRFQLSGNNDYFVLSAYAGAEPAIRRSLPGARFTVLYDPARQKMPLWAKRPSYVAFVVFVDGSPVRPYRLVAAEAARDFAWAPLAGGFAAMSALGLLVWAALIRFRREQTRPNSAVGSHEAG
jgi:hypothetical protein